MKKPSILAAFYVLIVAVSALPSEGDVAVVRNLASMPLTFTANQGQWDEQVKFRANAGGAAMWFTTDGAYYQFTRRVPAEKTSGIPSRSSRAVGSERSDRKSKSFETMMIKASFVGANASPEMVGEKLLDYKCNYFIGNDPARWRTDVPNYSSVLYKDVYPGIDLKYYGNGGEMEYDFIVSPGADLSRIRVQYEGVESVSINVEGELVVTTAWGEVVERRPVIYQLINGMRAPVEGRYELTGKNTFGFSIDDEYDSSLPLIIDPVLSYSTYLGGSGNEYALSIAVDASDCVYVTGGTTSLDFPVQDAYQSNHSGGSLDAYVTKLNSAGDAFVYSTYLGGHSQDEAEDIAVDGDGCAYVAGFSDSPDLPLENPFQTDQDTTDAFVIKLNSAGNGLVYSTYLGGSDEDYCLSLALDGSGCVYVTGETHSSDFPTENAYQGAQDTSDVFVTKLNSSGDGLVYSTYLGGDDGDTGFGVAVDDDGYAYVVGFTLSTDFPTENAYQATPPGAGDCFVTKLNTTGNGLVYSTYLGGSSTDYILDIAVDGSGYAYVAGETLSPDFPTESAFQTYQGNWDIFVARLNGSGSGLVYSTYLGGSDHEIPSAIALDDWGCAYIIGSTWSTDFPTVNAYQPDHQGDEDAFVTKLNSSGRGLVYSTYLGGTGYDVGSGLALDNSGRTCVSGTTTSIDFPTQDALQPSHHGGQEDAFITKFSAQPCCWLRGNVDNSTQVDILDIDYYINWLYRGGGGPDCLEEADVDDSGQPDILDIDYMIDWLYRGGPEVVPCP